MNLMRLHPNAEMPGIPERILELACMVAARLIYGAMAFMARRRRA